MRIRLMVDIEHSKDVSDIAALTQEQPVVHIVKNESPRDWLRPEGILFTGRFIGAEPVEGVGE